MKQNTKQIALVLSSGGARGIAHIGVIQELEARDYKITSIAGASMGALIGGFYAAGQLKDYTDWLLTLDRMDVLRLVDFSISSKGLVKGRRIIEKMKEIIPDRDIKDLNIPFTAVATDIISGEEKVFSEGNLYEAIRASISIPTVFQPKEINDHFYVDGGVLNPVPVDRIQRVNNDLLFVSDVNGIHQKHLQEANAKEKKHPKKEDSGQFSKQLLKIQHKITSIIPSKETDDLGIFNLTNKSIGLMLHKIASLTLEKSNCDLIFRIARDSYGTYEFHHASEIIDLGRVNAKKMLDQFESDLNV